MSSPEFYANARAYDIAFGDRDFDDECNFLEWCWRTYALTPERRFLELACGPGRHAITLAKRGWRASGLDLSPEMLEYAGDVASAAGAHVRWLAADMRDFSLDAPASLIACLMESLSHLVTNDDVVAHLKTVSRNLLPGGLYVLEMAHPSTIWRDGLPNLWTRRDGDMEVDILFGHQDDPYDWVTQQWQVTSRLTIRQAGQPERVVAHQHPHRWYMAQELNALADLSGAFSAAWYWGDMLLPPPAFESDAERMILILRK
ncbi:MAG: class I SAM-dependent methyltransferase [Thermoflexales bacterium]|nr:class I SAM-dependent methyltransferase [Thermoflexales bacterium]